MCVCVKDRERDKLAHLKRFFWAYRENSVLFCQDKNISRTILNLFSLTYTFDNIKTFTFQLKIQRSENLVYFCVPQAENPCDLKLFIIYLRISSLQSKSTHITNISTNILSLNSYYKVRKKWAPGQSIFQSNGESYKKYQLIKSFNTWSYMSYPN